MKNPSDSSASSWKIIGSLAAAEGRAIKPIVHVSVLRKILVFTDSKPVIISNLGSFIHAL